MPMNFTNARSASRSQVKAVAVAMATLAWALFVSPSAFAQEVDAQEEASNAAEKLESIDREEVLAMMRATLEYYREENLGINSSFSTRIENIKIDPGGFVWRRPWQGAYVASRSARQVPQAMKDLAGELADSTGNYEVVTADEAVSCTDSRIRVCRWKGGHEDTEAVVSFSLPDIRGSEASLWFGKYALYGEEAKELKTLQMRIHFERDENGNWKLIKGKGVVVVS